MTEWKSLSREDDMCTICFSTESAPEFREIDELLLWHSTDQGLRETVVEQTAAVLMNRSGGRSVNQVDKEPSQEKTLDDYFGRRSSAG